MYLRAGTVLTRVRITTADNLTDQDRVSLEPEERLTRIKHDQTDKINIKKVGLGHIIKTRSNAIARRYF